MPHASAIAAVAHFAGDSLAFEESLHEVVAAVALAACPRLLSLAGLRLRLLPLLIRRTLRLLLRLILRLPLGRGRLIGRTLSSRRRLRLACGAQLLGRFPQMLGGALLMLLRRFEIALLKRFRRLTLLRASLFERFLRPVQRLAQF